MKKQIIKKLAKLANHLDKKGLYKEANEVDELIGDQAKTNDEQNRIYDAIQTVYDKLYEDLLGGRMIAASRYIVINSLMRFLSKRGVNMRNMLSAEDIKKTREKKLPSGVSINLPIAKKILDEIVNNFEESVYNMRDLSWPPGSESTIEVVAILHFLMALLYEHKVEDPYYEDVYNEAFQLYKKIDEKIGGS